MQNPITESRTRKRRREQILAVAREVFFTRGIMSVTMKEIAILANTSRTTLYDYYKDKDQLLAALRTEYLSELYDFPCQRDPSLSGAQQLELLLTVYLNRLLEKPRAVLFFTEFNRYNQSKLSPVETVYNRMKFQIYIDLKAAITKGLADKSLPMNLNPQDVDIIDETLFGLASRYSIRESYAYRDIVIQKSDLERIVRILMKGLLHL